MESLDIAEHSISGILAWYSLIHLPPPDLDGVLAEFRRAMAPAGKLVVGFFDGDEIAPFDHKVVTAYRWPVDEFSERLARAGFAEVERLERPGEGRSSTIRSHRGGPDPGLSRVSRHAVTRHPRLAFSDAVIGSAISTA